MKLSLLDSFCCPDCRGNLLLGKAIEANGEIESGELYCVACEARFPIVRFVPRFVSSENYTSSFGFQWNRFRQTQLDSHSGLPISRERFFRETGWLPNEMAGKRVLDMGCGAGRFAEIALSCGAEVVALDYSSAVDACWQNLGRHPNLHLIQANIYSLPFRGKEFDFIYCFGVLQHTPDVHQAFSALPEQLSSGGRLAVDLYLRNWGNLIHPRFWLRPITTRIKPEKLFAIVERSVPALLTLSRAAGRIPFLGRYLKRLIPVANYADIYNLSDRQLLEWATLDTYDWFSPRYDKPQTTKTLRTWFQEAKLDDVTVFKRGLLVGRGTKPHA
jgi:SAM-dependent methyltransferase